MTSERHERAELIAAIGNDLDAAARRAIAQYRDLGEHHLASAIECSKRDMDRSVSKRTAELVGPHLRKPRCAAEWPAYVDQLRAKHAAAARADRAAFGKVVDIDPTRQAVRVRAEAGRVERDSRALLRTAQETLDAG